jgi:hypothetical protein
MSPVLRLIIRFVMKKYAGMWFDYSEIEIKVPNQKKNNYDTGKI